MSELRKYHLDGLARDQCIVFGPVYNEGHFAYSSSGGRHYLNNGFGRWMNGKDGIFPPQFNGEVPGEALLHQYDGFCVLAFWARCFDKRPGSNIAFVIYGNHDFAAACEISRGVFGWVWDKFNFEVRPCEDRHGARI